MTSLTPAALQAAFEESSRPIPTISYSLDVSVTVLGNTSSIRDPEPRPEAGTVLGISADFISQASDVPEDTPTADFGFGKHFGVSVGEGTLIGHIGFSIGSPVGVTGPKVSNLFKESNPPVSPVALPDQLPKRPQVTSATGTSIDALVRSNQ